MWVHGPVLVSGPTPFPGGCPPGTGDPAKENAQYEPYLAVDPADPSRLAAAWIQDGGLSVVSAFSRDGGLTWKRVLVPGVSRCTGGNTGGAVNPWSSFGPDRALYAVSLGADVEPGFPLTNAQSQVVVNRSADAGATWSPAVAIQPQDGAFHDKPTITADPSAPGKAYAVWAKRSGPGGASGVTLFARTADGGRSWSTPLPIYDPGPLPYPQWAHGDVITALPDGTLLDVFGLMNDTPFISSTGSVPDSVMAMRSGDGGQTWSAPIKIADVPSRFADDGDSPATRLVTRPIPAVASDRRGTIYVAWHENPSPTSGRILLSRSSDGGRNWSAPETVVAPQAQAFLPALAISRAGVIGLLWYDTRFDTPGDGQLTTELWFAHSHDHGRSWENTHVAGPFDALTAPDFFNQGRLLGDSISLVGTPTGFDALFTQARPASQRGATTIYFDRLQLGTTPPAAASQLTVTVRPRRVRAGRRARFRFTVTVATTGPAGSPLSLPVGRALIRFAGRSVRTDGRGRASIVRTLRSSGRHHVAVTKPGYLAGDTMVKVLRPR